VQDKRTSSTHTSTHTEESQDPDHPAPGPLQLQEDEKFPHLPALVKPSLFQQYQDKIFTEYMALRAVGKGDPFIPVGTTFIQMEEKFLLWMRELEHLRTRKKDDQGDTVAGDTVDK
jgi:hypothetical protein